jgi:hypothetical protein
MPQALVQQLRCHSMRGLMIDKTGNFEGCRSGNCGKLKRFAGD